MRFRIQRLHHRAARTKALLQSAFLSACFSLSIGCSLQPQEHPLDPTTLQGLLLSLTPSAEQLPVSGFGFWIRADDAVNQSGLTYVPDRSGYGSSVTGPQIPIDASIVNGRPAAPFSGSSRLFGWANQLQSNVFSSLVVFRNGAPPPTASHQSLLIIGAASGGIQFALNPASAFLASLKSNSVALFTGVTSNSNTAVFNIGSITYDPGGNDVMYLNGTSDVSGTNVQTFTQDGSLSIGGRNDNSAYFTGHIAEVIIYTRSLSVSDRELLECYLSRRYAISVPFACQ